MARMDAPAVRPPLTRYLCPLPSCDWHHDVPDEAWSDASMVFDAMAPGLPDLMAAFDAVTPDDFAAASAVLGPDGVLGQMCGALAISRARRTDDQLWTHFQTHPLREWVLEAARLGAELAALNHRPLPSAPLPEDPSLRDWVLEVLRMGNELAELQAAAADQGPAD